MGWAVEPAPAEAHVVEDAVGIRLLDRMVRRDGDAPQTVLHPVGLLGNLTQ